MLLRPPAPCLLHLAALSAAARNTGATASGDESILRYLLKAVGTYDLNIVVLISGFSNPDPHSSGNNSTNPYTGRDASTVL